VKCEESSLPAHHGWTHAHLIASSASSPALCTPAIASTCWPAACAPCTTANGPRAVCPVRDPSTRSHAASDPPRCPQQPLQGQPYLNPYPDPNPNPNPIPNPNPNPNPNPPLCSALSTAASAALLSPPVLLAAASSSASTALWVSWHRAFGG